jgi:hypothetical protein
MKSVMRTIVRVVM